MIRLALIICLSGFITRLSAQIKVSPDKHYLISKNGKPFFWLGDTAWELFHRLNRKDASLYLQNRADKGFTVIQAVILAEMDGLNVPNVYGDKPLIANDPARPNESYFKHVDYIIDEANKRGLIIALLPTWGDKWNKSNPSPGPRIFTSQNAAKYGEWLGKRYKNKSLVWVMGGDRNIDDGEEYGIIRAMANGIKKYDSSHLFTFHPQGGRSSYQYFPDEPWLDIHMSQTGHKAGNPDYIRNIEVSRLPVAKPHVNGEPNYEDHPNDFRPVENGWLDDFDAREAAYWNMLSGGAGHTYGNHNIWQMYTEKRSPINNARTAWPIAMNQPGAYQVGWMRRMFENFPWQKLRLTQSVILGDNPEGLQYKIAAVADDFMMVYIPYGDKTSLSTACIHAKFINGWWFNPRDGKTIAITDFENTGTHEFVPGSVGRGSDWILIIKDAAKKYNDPKID